MLRKVAVLMGGELRTRMKGGQQDASSARYGYHHSYFDSHGIDLSKLSAYPSDIEFQAMIDVAHTEALALLRALGMDATGISVIASDRLAEALAVLSNDAAFTEETAPSKSEDENLTELLQADQVHFNKGQNILDADEPLTDLGFQAAATIVHDHLRLYAPALPNLSC